jgi:hypothetical protein
MSLDRIKLARESRRSLMALIRSLALALLLFTDIASARMLMRTATSSVGDFYGYESEIERHGQYRRYWEVRIFKRNRQFGWHSSFSQVDIDCANRTRRVLQVIWKRGATGLGQPTLRQWRTDPWVGIVPGGLFDRILIHICK